MDVIIVGGRNVFPEDIESALTDHGLAQAVVLETEPGRIEARPETSRHRLQLGGQGAGR